MEIIAKAEDRRLLLRLQGELDHHGAKAVMEELTGYIDAARPRHLTLDLGGLTFTDSSGIAVLLRTWRQMERTQGTMRVVNTPAQADKVFRAAGLQRLIRFE